MGRGLWRYEPGKSEWVLIVKAGKAPISEDVAKVSIGYLGTLNNKLALGVWSADSLFCMLTDLNGDNIEVMPCPGKNKNIGTMYVRELNGALYGISEPYGVFRYTEGATAWDSLPSARGRKETMTVDNCQDAAGLLGVNTSVGCSQEVPAGLDEGVASITVHDGHIIVGYKFNALNDRGVFRLNDDDTWTSLTPNYMYQDTVALSDAMESTEALLSHKGWLIAGGSFFAFPRFWVPLDSATPQFGDWRIVYDN